MCGTKEPVRTIALRIAGSQADIQRIIVIVMKADVAAIVTASAQIHDTCFDD